MTSERLLNAYRKKLHSRLLSRMTSGGSLAWWHGGTRAAKLEVKEVLALIFSFLFYGKVDLDIRGAVTIMSFLFLF